MAPRRFWAVVLGAACALAGHERRAVVRFHAAPEGRGAPELVARPGLASAWRRGASFLQTAWEFELPPWAAIALSAAAAVLAVAGLARLYSALAPAPGAASLEEELDSGRLRVAQLMEALQQREQREQREQHEQREQREQREVAAEPEGGVEARALARERAFGREVAEASRRAVESVAPFAARAASVHHIVKEGGRKISAETEVAARRGLQDMLQRVQQAMGEEGGLDPSADLLELEQLAQELHDMFPALGLLVAGFLSGPQLRSLVSSCAFQIIVNIVLLAIFAGVAARSWRQKCADSPLWVWCYGMMALALLMVLTHVSMRSMANAALERVQAVNIDEDRNDLLIGNAVWDAALTVKRSTHKLLTAFVSHDVVRRSCAYRSAMIAWAFFLLWGGFGVHISITHAVEDEQHCHARALLLLVRVFSVFYLLIFTWAFLGLALWLVVRLSAVFSCVGVPILRFAMQLDDSTGLGVPVFVTVARSLLLGRPTDTLWVQRWGLQQELHELERQVTQCQKQIDRRRAQLQVVRQQEEETSRSDQELFDRFEQDVHTAFDRAAPLIALAAAASAGDSVVAATAQEWRSRGGELGGQVWAQAGVAAAQVASAAPDAYVRAVQSTAIATSAAAVTAASSEAYRAAMAAVRTGSGQEQ